MTQKAIRWSHTNPWGSWNRQNINAVMRQKVLCEVRIGVLKKSENLFADSFTWVGISGNPSIDYWDTKGVYQTGYHSVSGHYSKIGLFLQDFRFDLEFAGEGDDFIYKVIPRTLHDDYELFVGFLIGAQRENHQGGSIVMREAGCMFDTPEGRFVIDVEGGKSSVSFAAPYAGYFFKSDSALYIRCNNKRSMAEADRFLQDTRQHYAAGRVHGEGFLGEGIVDSLVKVMSWNKVYDHVHDTFKADVTRLWAPNSCYYTFYWDNFFTSLLFGLESERMAYDQVDSVCSEFKDGFLPQCAFDWGSSNMINPPVGSFCLLKLYRQFENKALLEVYFDCLYATNTYLITHKSHRGDGLLQLRDERINTEEHTFHQILGTGLDNSPMYDNAKDVNLNDVGMSSVFALDCRMLAEIAAILGRLPEKEMLEKRYETVKNAINDTMWDESAGIYCNTTLDGQYLDVYSPTSFYPLIAGVADGERAERLVREHLLNEEEFWGEYVIPSISKAHPSYHKQDYWCGCAWPPMNLLVYEGLKVCGFYHTAFQLAQKSLAMYRQNWVDHGWVLENFSTKTGGITKNSVPMYTWGGLMAYMGMEEVMEAMPLGGLKFGNLQSEAAAIRNARVHQDLYDVVTGRSVMVYRNGKLLLETDTPAIIKDFRMENAVCHLEVLSEEPGVCTLYGDMSQVAVKVGESLLHCEPTGGRVTIPYPGMAKGSL